MSGYDFGAEMQNIKNAETTSKYIDTHGVEIVTIKSQKFEAPEGRKPFIQVVFETEDGRISNSRFYVANPGDSEDAANFKRERIKRLLENCGANMELPADGPLKDAVGKKVQVLFKNVEYVTENKDLNNKPEIRTSIEYSFCEKVGKTINGNESYFHGYLKPEARAAFEGKLLMWERDNKHLSESLNQSTAPTTETPLESKEESFPEQTQEDEF